LRGGVFGASERRFAAAAADVYVLIPFFFALFAAGRDAWCALTEHDLRSICHTDWITHKGHA